MQSCASPLEGTPKMFLTAQAYRFKVLKTRLLRRGFHTLIKGVSFSSTDVGSHNPPSFKV